MSVIRLTKGKWHSIQEKDGIMFATEMCDCGFCQTRQHKIDEGDTLISRLRVAIAGGHLKDVHIISGGIWTIRNTTTTLENVRFDQISELE